MRLTVVRTASLPVSEFLHHRLCPRHSLCAQRLKTKVGNLLVPGNHEPWAEVRDTLNKSLLGWSNYFSYGTRRSVFRGVDRYVYERVRDFLARRHKVAGRGTKRFSCEIVYGERGLLRLERLPSTAPSCASP
jgi:RNA-directed DNA polymerase